MLDGTTLKASRPDDSFHTSVLARSAALRVLVVALGLVPLWLAVAWAVAVP